MKTYRLPLLLALFASVFVPSLSTTPSFSDWSDSWSSSDYSWSSSDYSWSSSDYSWSSWSDWEWSSGSYTPCDNAWAFINYTEGCAYEVRYQLQNYLLYGSDFNPHDSYGSGWWYDFSWGSWDSNWWYHSDFSWSDFSWSSSDYSWSSSDYSWSSSDYSWSSSDYSWSSSDYSWSSSDYSWSSSDYSWSSSDYSWSSSDYSWSSSDYSWSSYEYDMDICGSAMQGMESCMNRLTENCDNEEFTDAVPAMISGYKGQFCNNDGELRENVAQYEGVLNQNLIATLGEDISCIGFTEITDLFLSGECDVDWNDFDLEGDILEVQDQLETAFRQTFACVRRTLTVDYDCAGLDELRPLVLYLYVDVIIPGIQVDFVQLFNGFDSSATRPNAAARSTVAVFGDPHITHYGMASDEYVTCDHEGHVEYLKNNYVVVTGDNTRAAVDDRATFMTEVDIKIYNGISNDESDMVAHYQSGNSGLSDTFVYPESGTPSGVTLEDLGDGSIRISSINAGLSLTLRNPFDTYMLVVRMSDTVFDASFGILVDGCDAGEIIDADATIDAEVRRRKKRDVECGVGTYADACLYDFAITGNADQAQASVQSMDALVSSTEELDSILVQDSGDDDDNGGGSDNDGVNSVHSTPVLVLTAVMLAIQKLYV